MFDVPIHKLIIHFPIALTVIAVIYDSWAVYSTRPQLHETSYGLNLWGTVFALAAVVTGLQLAGVTRVDRAVVTGHAGFGIGSCLVITVLGMMRYSARAREETGYKTVWLILEVGAAVLIVATAITGHRL
jgi:uncharacterized membrane protein